MPCLRRKLKRSIAALITQMCRLVAIRNNHAKQPFTLTAIVCSLLLDAVSCLPPRLLTAQPGAACLCSPGGAGKLLGNLQEEADVFAGRNW